MPRKSKNNPSCRRVESKPTNPKDILGDARLPMGDVSAISMAYLAIGLAEGKYKYGRYNYRKLGVRISVYNSALERHRSKFYDEGEWADPKTKVPHLASMMACCAIMLDSIALGNITDDRPPSVPVSRTIKELERTLKHLQKTFRTHKPKQYTIKDN